MASPAPRSARRVSIWNNLLWLVAAVFFAATVWSGVRLVHDDRGLIVRMTAHDKAVELATLLSVRLHGMGRSDSASVTGALEELLRLEQLDTSRVLRLDRETVALTLNGSPIFGSLPNPSRFQGSAPLHEDLSRYVITVSISGHQLPMQLLFPFSHERLLTNGLFILATIVTLSVAILSSRRELRLVEARSNFVAGVSHDLRMPLAQILLAGETISLGRERGEEHRRTLSASIVREARRLVALVDNVLLFARTGSVGLAPRIEAVSLNELLAAVVDSVSLSVDDAGQVLEIEAGSSVSVLADRSLLRQALVNVVDNAIKYGPRGQRIRVEVATEDGRARVSVVDQGPGIPAADRGVVLEPYRRLARDESSERTGSGLGLAVARQIVEACDGTISITEASPTGTRVTIALRTA